MGVRTAGLPPAAVQAAEIVADVGEQRPTDRRSVPKLLLLRRRRRPGFADREQDVRLLGSCSQAGQADTTLRQQHDARGKIRLVAAPDIGADQNDYGNQERLIFSGRRSKTARVKFRSAREELITLNQPVLGSSPRGLTSKSHLISSRHR
jgi:hypothetical protein